MINKKVKPNVKVTVNGGTLSLQCTKRVQAKQFEPVETSSNMEVNFEVNFDVMDANQRAAFLESDDFNNFAEEMADFVIYHTESALAKALEEA